jgi:hypothetical protein
MEEYERRKEQIEFFPFTHGDSVEKRRKIIEQKIKEVLNFFSFS